MNPQFSAACEQLEAAQATLAAAQRAVDDAKDAVRAFVTERAEGAVTTRDGEWKSTVTFVVNRTVDQAMVAAMLQDDKFRWAVQRMFPAKFSLDTAEMRFFQNNEPEFYAQLATAITAKPGKPSVRVERVAEERRVA